MGVAEFRRMAQEARTVAELLPDFTAKEYLEAHAKELDRYAFMIAVESSTFDAATA